MTKSSRRLTGEELREAARAPFVAALSRSDFSAFAAKMEAGLIRGAVISGLAGGLVQYGIYETRETDADPVVEYGRVTLDPYTGACLGTEILNMPKLT